MINESSQKARGIAGWLRKNANAMMAIATVAASGAAIFAVVESKTALERNQRAWLAPAGIRIDEPFKRDTYHEVLFSYGNVGKEPATKISAILRPIVFSNEKGIRDPVALRTAIDTAMDNKTCNARSPDQDGFVAYPSNPRDLTIRVGIQPDQVNGIIDKSAYLLIAGCLTYETFGKVRHSAFCRFFDYNVGKSPPADWLSSAFRQISFNGTSASNSMSWRSSVCFVAEHAN